MGDLYNYDFYYPSKNYNSPEQNVSESITEIKPSKYSYFSGPIYKGSEKDAIEIIYETSEFFGGIETKFYGMENGDIYIEDVAGMKNGEYRINSIRGCNSYSLRDDNYFSVTFYGIPVFSAHLHPRSTIPSRKDIDYSLNRNMKSLIICRNGNIYGTYEGFSGNVNHVRNIKNGSWSLFYWDGHFDYENW